MPKSQMELLFKKKTTAHQGLSGLALRFGAGSAVTQ